MWDPNDWETPDHVARFMGSMILPTDSNVLEPAAGTGQIVRHLPSWVDITALEVNPVRYSKGSQFLQAGWYCADFLAEDWPLQDVVITNPPFPLGCEFLAKSLQLLDPSYPLARCLFLLPLDYFSSKKRFDSLRSSGAHIHHLHVIRGRIAYLKDGIPQKGRQIYDAVFDIRLGAERSVSLVDPS